jgi:hypothetical protein
MQRPNHVQLIPAIAAALGGRLVHAFAWLFWMWFCFAATTLRDFRGPAVIPLRTKAVFAMSATVAAFFLVLWALNVASPTLRAQRVELTVGPVFKFGVYAVPLLGLCALLAPAMLL